MANDDQEPEFWFVYLLRSLSDPSRVYVGFTTDLDAGLAAHYAGKSRHTSKYRPWRTRFRTLSKNFVWHRIC